MSPPTSDKQKKLAELDSQNMLELMGMQSLPETDQENLLYDISSVITTEFFTRKVDPLLTERQRTEMQAMVDRDEKLDSIIMFLMKAVPNLLEHMADFTRIQKATYLRKQFLAEEQRVQREYDLYKDEPEKATELDTKIHKYRMAQQLVDECDWDALRLLMSS